MAGKSAGYAIGIGIQDGASAGLDAINKRIAALQAPADRFNKSLQKFGEVTGINRAAEGMQTLGDRALGAARSIERMAGPMATITSLASLGGIIEMTRKWAEAGNQIAKTSGALNTPVTRLSALRGAARLAGSSADVMDASLKGLGDTLATAKFRGGPMVPLLNELHIGFQGVGKEARTGADALGDVADAVARYKDPHAQIRLLQQLGISEDLLPLLQKGRKGLEEFLGVAGRTGGVMTAEMAENARKMNSSWNQLGLAIEGVGNRIANSWSGTATKILDTTTHWIENNKKLADSYAENGAAFLAWVGLLGGLRVAPWILKVLGVGGPAAALTLPLFLSGDTAQNPEAQIPHDPVTNPNLFDRNGAIGAWWTRHMPGWLGGAPRANMAPGGGAAGNALDTGTVGRAKLVYDGLVARGMDHNTALGFAANAVQESRADPHSPPGDGGAAHGLFMWRDTADGGRRYTDYVNKYGHAPEQGTLDEQLDYTMHELKGSERRAWRNILQRSGNSPGERAAAISTYYERPKDTAAEESRRRDIASRLANLFTSGWSGTPPPPPGAATPGDGAAPPGTAPPGTVGGTAVGGTVRVDVHLHGAPSGTRATATGTGAVMVVPPNIQTSMPLAY